MFHKERRTDQSFNLSEGGTELSDEGVAKRGHETERPSGEGRSVNSGIDFRLYSFRSKPTITRRSWLLLHAGHGLFFNKDR